ncbi:patatin-like phospholipase family protein [Marinagarivorans cellulosilyticus]|uniref:NTE family protein n=1 Tax=Marinagarivorans cellulosilyticus TaxID=2721545 RepID=A0AAN2BKU0_9GAMM|nr:patatin-like phospholipase family protein [Marinagarivorans cellulosilyticus]BCD98433.1 NTE family protein [Marinagarivorans cellulosilyticus]
MAANALILSGGGARAAYQAGVLLALSELLPCLENPFPIICGTSAGAINALAMAAHPGTFNQSAQDLAQTWRELEVEKVYKTGWGDLTKGLFKVAGSLFHQGVARGKPLGLLDNSPLRDLLSGVIPFDNIQNRVDAGLLEAVCVTALGYSSGESVSFFQGNPALRGWRRARRVGTPSLLTVEHLLASSAIPAVFPAVPLNKEFFGDGAMRQLAPLSPALHLGASRMFVIGVSHNPMKTRWFKPKRALDHPPSIAQILGQMFNSAFIDTLEGDLEHLDRTNMLLKLAADKELCEKTYNLRPVDTLVITPSKPIDKIAGRRVRDLPKSLRFFMRAVGATARGGGASVASYLLFSHQYCNELMELGYQDAMWEKAAIEDFFSHPCRLPE